jgi:MGT family glycosyltransferase
MKILMASTPATGHLNPLLAIGRILIAGGHEVVFLSGSVLRDRIEAIGAGFHALPAGADFDLRDIVSVLPELKSMPHGPERRRLSLNRIFVDPIPAQHRGLQQVLQNFPADVVIGDDTMFGLLPMLLGPRSKRPPIIMCGTSFLHCRRDDGAPHFVGLPPATTQAQRKEYAAAYRQEDRLIWQPTADRLNKVLAEVGADRLCLPLFESVVHFADAYLQLSVPSFEYPRSIPGTVHFVGTPPIVANQVSLPSWANDLDGSRRVVLVTQGTVANDDFDRLIGPTLRALADQSDLLVVATAGGRPIEAIPGPIPANARLAQYLPFEWILPKADTFVTNGGYGSVNQALSFGVPLVTAGLTQDKADVNARVAWSGVGIDLATNEPTAEELRVAIRTVLDMPNYRQRASLMKEEFASIDTNAEILRIVSEVAHQTNNTIPAGDDRSRQPDVLGRMLAGPANEPSFAVRRSA